MSDDLVLLTYSPHSKSASTRYGRLTANLDPSWRIAYSPPPLGLAKQPVTSSSITLGTAMHTRLAHQACIALVAGVVFFANLGGPKLWDDDEPRNAQCAREMYERGDPIEPTFNHEPRTDKPALLYWLMMGSYSLFGVNEFAARFPSAVLGIGTVLLTYHLGRLLFRPRVGLWAGLIMATNVMFDVDARAATPDSALIFFTTLALLAYVGNMTAWREGSFLKGWRSIRSGEFAVAFPRSWKGAAAVYAPMGFAVLAKGPVGLLLPCAGIGLFLLLACVRPESSARAPRRETLFSLWIYRARLAIARTAEYTTWIVRAERAMWPNVLVATVAAVALPWYLWVTIKTHGDWTRSFFLTHNLDRYLHPMEGHHGSMSFHVLALVVCFFPWSFLLPAASAQLARRVRTGEPAGAAGLLLMSWIAVWFVVFSLSGTKLPSYVLPAYPALSIVCGSWVADWIEAPVRRRAFRWLSFGWAGLPLVGVGLAIGMSVVSARWLSGQANLAWIGAIPVVGAAIGGFFHRRRREGWAFGSLVVTSAALLVALFAVAAVPISRRQNSVLLAEMLQRTADKPDQLGLFQIGFAGVVFYADRPIHDYKRNRWSAQSFFETWDHPMLVTDADGFQRIRNLLPADSKIVERHPRFLKRGDLIVIARKPPNALARKSAPPSEDRPPIEEARKDDKTFSGDSLRR
jgi:4-amino-4-deoxy-L-arabinose transferase-like glycosyltransferase